MRAIDLHAHPGTQAWIDSQGPFVEALARHWNREWVGRPEESVVAEFREAGVQPVLVAFDIESVTGAPACGSDYVAAMRDRHPDVILQAWGGFYRSGDLVRRHPSGAFLVEGRIKDLVNRGGEKISAEEVENLILGHPAVRDVACVAVPDPVLGERMCACVIPRDGRTLTLGELVAHLLGLGMARFKLPERLELVDEFPLSPFGKVSKKALMERLT